MGKTFESNHIVKTCKLNYKVHKDLSLASHFRSSQILTKFGRISPQIEIGGTRKWGKSPRDVKKRSNSFNSFFLGVVFKSTVFWEEKLLFSRWNWTRLKARELRQQAENDRKKHRETEVGERRLLMAASAAKRERRLKEIFWAEGHCSAERNGRDEVATLDATRQALYKCIPSFTQPTLSFTGLLPPGLCAPGVRDRWLLSPTFNGKPT